MGAGALPVSVLLKPAKRGHTGDAFTGVVFTPGTGTSHSDSGVEQPCECFRKGDSIARGGRQVERPSLLLPLCRGQRVAGVPRL